MRMSLFNVIYETNGTMFFCDDISCAEYEELKLSMLPRYCPICAKEMPFSDLSKKKFIIFLSRSPPHHGAQAIPPKETKTP